MTLISLREYQEEALKTIHDEFKAGVNRQLISLPTGSGKTVIMAALAQQLNKKTLLIAHREELIQQAAEKFKLVWPKATIGICMAEKDEIDAQVVIGSVQSCSRPKRLKKLKEQGFELLLVDEAHHSAADSYQNVVNELGFLSDPKKLLIGVTATPKRADKQCLSGIFEKITFSRSISTMIKAGYLAPAVGRKILTSFYLKKFKTISGDFCIDELAEAVNTPERNAFIVEKFQAYAHDRKAVAFCVDVQHCHDLADAFKRRGINAEAVWGDMSKSERANVLEGLKTGRVQIATSCGVLCEGFDEPSLDAIVMARPTKSQSLYIQCVGRGLRLWPGKENCLVLDFSDRGHNLDTVVTLSSTIPEAKFLREKVETEIEKKEVDRSPKIEVLDECDCEFDILGNTRFIWIPIGDNEWSLLDDVKREIVMRPEGKGYVAALYQTDGTSHQIVKAPLPIEYCSGICEDYARRHLKIAFADMKSPWMSTATGATQGQREFLVRNHAWKDGMNKAEAAIEIRKTIAAQNKQRRLLHEEPITAPQKYFLEGRGVDVSNMTKMQARQMIAEIKREEALQCG